MQNKEQNDYIYMKEAPIADELFKQSKTIEHTKNIDLTIRSDLVEYTKEEYIDIVIKQLELHLMLLFKLMICFHSQQWNTTQDS